MLDPDEARAERASGCIVRTLVYGLLVVGFVVGVAVTAVAQGL